MSNVPSSFHRLFDVALFVLVLCLGSGSLRAQEPATPASAAPAAPTDPAPPLSSVEELEATVVESSRPAPAPAPAPSPAPQVVPQAPPVEAPAPVIIDDVAPYVADVPVSAGRNDIPQMENARSTTTFTGEFIDDLSPLELENVITRSAGVSLSHAGESRTKDYSIRGFYATQLRNGFSGIQFGANAAIEPYSLERLEVLKGSDSIAYGDTTPGGFIHYVSKRPLGREHGEVGVEFGSFNAVSPRFDIGGRIGGVPADGGKLVIDDKSPLYSSEAAYAKMPVGEGQPSIDYRIVGLYDHHESFKDFDHDSNRYYIAPSVRYHFNDTTSLTVYAEIQEDRTFMDYGVPVDRFGRFVTPRDFIVSHPGEYIDRESRFFGYDFVHEINDAWTFEHRGVYQYASYSYSELALPFAYDDLTRTVTRIPAWQGQIGDYYAMQFNLKGDFEIFGLRNRLYSGVDISQTETVGSTRYDPGTPLLLNVDNPVYGPLPRAVTPYPPFGEKTVRQGFWVQDHLDLTEQFILSGGLRFDHIDQNGTIYEESNPQVGAVYRLTESVSAFGNYSESFQPVSSFDRFGNVLDPETAQGHEFGVKFLSPDRRFSATAAYFDITRQNVPTADPLDAFASISTGEQNAQGFEFEVMGEVLPNFTVQASFAHIDAVVTEDNWMPVGNRLVGIPEDSASLWGRYDFEGGALDGFGIGAGFRYIGDRAAGEFNTVFLDPYTVVQAGLFYERNDWEFSVLVENLTDERALSGVFFVESTGTGSARGNIEIPSTQVTAKVTRHF